MGRLPKKGVDYFSHDTNASTSPTLFTVESRFGNDGYAFWFKLLEFLGTKETLCINTEDKAEWLYFVAKVRVTTDKAVEILDVLADTEAIDKELWNNHRVIWSGNFADRLADVYRKRGIAKPQKPVFCDEKTPTPVLDEEEKAPIAAKPKRKSKESTDAEKTKYADFVKMKPEEYDTLCAKVGKPATDKCIEVLDNYKGSKGKTYKDDYRAILSWVLKKVTEEYPNLIQKPSDSSEEGGNPFGEYR